MLSPFSLRQVPGDPPIPPADVPPPPEPPDPDDIPTASNGCRDTDADGVGDVCDPILGKAVGAAVISGKIFVKLPGAGLRSAVGPAQAVPPAGAGPGFVELKGSAVLPINSIVDAEQGRLEVTSAAGAAVAGKTPTQRADFYSGIFQIRQARAKKPTTEVRLRTANFNRACASTRTPRAGGAAAAQSSSRKVVSRLWGNGKGRFRSRGRNSTATVRGTIWLTQERCDGTLTLVRKGIVVVRDLRRLRTITVRAGHSYLARSKRVAAKSRPR